jgi:Mg2+ and Co2+ transporter CorA
LLRIVVLGVRASGVVVREETRRATAPAVGPVEVSVLRAGKSPALHPASWEEFLQWAKAPGEEWYHVSNLAPDQLRRVALALGLTPAFVESHLAGASYPHLEVTDRHAALFVWLPELQVATPTERNGLLLLATNHSVFTLSRRSPGLLQAVTNALPKITVNALPFPVRMTCAFVQAVLDRNEELVGRFERELRALEEVPVRESRPPFFEQTFRLKKELAVTQSDLWRLKGILTALAESRVTLPGGGTGEPESFRSLAESADFLYETVVNTREGLLSVIDLHLNVVSFEVNRVMRVLAVVSVLGLIPAVIGGLFGMNLSDNPWPFTLPQVAFGVCLGMVLCLYLFLVKGWLR